MIFKYKAVTKAGEERTGTIEAIDKDTAISALQKRELVVISIQDSDDNLSPNNSDDLDDGNRKERIRQFRSQISSLLKSTIVSLSYITILSFGVGLIGLIGYMVIVKMPKYYAIPIALLIGSCIFMIIIFIKNKIKKTEKLKSEFITVAAHRLRTPLTRIEWMLSGLSESASLADNRETLASMKETLDNLVKAVNRLLDATEAEKPSLYYDYLFEKSRFGYIVQQVVADYSVGARKKDIKISVSIEENLPWVFVDKERMSVAIGALVENAIIYTATGGSVSVEVHKKNNSVSFSITDNGIGIPKDALPYIYTKFFRAKDAVSIDRDRAGLGLFIAKEIIKRHNGNTHVESKGKDRGSHFWFSIPIHP